MTVKRIRIHGRWVWQARIQTHGLRRSTLRSTKAEAKDAEAGLLRELQAQAERAGADATRPATLRELLDLYALELEGRGIREESRARVTYTRRALERLTPELLRGPVSEIGDTDIFAFRTARLREGRLLRETVNGVTVTRRVPTKPSTINRDLRTLRAALKKARPAYRFPAAAFFPEDETRVRWLRPEEELLVLGTMPSPFREIATLAALTLMRLSEIRLLRRESVHLEQGVIQLPQAKAGPRAVVLSRAAQDMLRAHLHAPARSPLVFPAPHGGPWSREQIGRMFRRAARAAGLRDFHFHDLRHHGATMALNAGFPGEVVMQLGGWKTARMMRRYAAVTDQTLRAAMEAVSGGGIGPGMATASGNARLTP